MADKGRRDEPIFFIYDHNMMKKEEDDLKDAILYFQPDDMTADDQCALCGQLMGMTLFLGATLSKSSPQIYKFEHNKFALKLVGAYSLGLQASNFTPDSLLLTKLNILYDTFVTYHGSIDSLKLRCKDSQTGFLKELKYIWKTILSASGVSMNPSLPQTFHAVRYIDLPKTGSHLFLQASHLLQSSQRRPYVLAGAIFYNNRVLSTQLPPRLTRCLTFLQNQMPNISRKTDFDLPIGCRIITIFLTDDEFREISPPDPHSRRHCKVTDFSVCRESEINLKDRATQSQKSRIMSRRLTCPNLASYSHNKKTHNVNAVSEKALSTFLINEQRKAFHGKQDSMSVEHVSWGKDKSKILLSHVPIVECRSGESGTDCETEVLGHGADETHFGGTYRQIELDENIFENCEGESSDEATNDDTTEDNESHPPMKSEKTSSEQFRSEDPIKLNGTSCDQPLSEEDPVKLPSRENGSFENVYDMSTKEEPSISDLEDEEKTVTLKESSDQPHSKEDPVKLPVGENGSFENKLDMSSKEEPSISDLEDEEKKVTFRKSSDQPHSKEDEENKDTLKKSHSPISDTVEISNRTDDADEVKHDKLNLSNSSSAADSRYYDLLSYEKTNTVSKDYNHAVYQHTADVHSNDQSSNDTVDNSDSVVKDTDDVGTNNICNESDHNCVQEGSKLSNRESLNCTELPVGVNETEIGVLNELITSDNTVSAADPLREVKLASVADSCVGCDLSQNVEFDETLIRNTDDSRSLKTSENTTGDKLDDASEKENVNPNIGIGKSESLILEVERIGYYETETEDESVSDEKFIPCITCLDLAAKQPNDTKGTKIIKCRECRAKPSSWKKVDKNGNQSEVFDFGRKDLNYESGTDTEGGSFYQPGTSVHHTQSETVNKNEPGSQHFHTGSSSFSSDVSTDSTISQFWTQGMEGLNDVTLYIQCHSDISLLLLMDNPDQYQENLLHSLWKGSLAHLADLDYYIKECMESDNDLEKLHTYRYTRYDKFSGGVEGNIDKTPITNKSDSQLHQAMAVLHSEFQQGQCLTDVTLRSQSMCCYGHRNYVNETYFQLEGQQRLVSGLPLPRDPVFTLDNVAKQSLARDRKLSLL